MSSQKPDKVRRENTPSSNRLEEEFEDVTKIGKGAYGVVYKAKKKLDGAYYAIKQVLVTKNKEKELREVKLHTRINHENVVRYFNAWIGEEYQKVESESDDQCSEEVTSLSTNNSESKESGQDTSSNGVVLVCPTNSVPITEYLYIQTEYCEMGTLRECIQENLYKDQDRMWQFFREISEGLSYIHGQDVVHRDLKPENIFLTSKSHIKIGDFGLATSEPRFEEQSNASDVGTFYYKAPEIGKTHMTVCKRKSEKVDIYSVGIIFFEMNYHRCETGSERYAVLSNLRSKEITLPSDFHNGETRAPQEKILRWLLNEDPERRPSADEILSSDLLPPPPQEENENGKVISRVIANPQCRLYKRLVQELFEQPEYKEQELDINDALEALNLKYCRKQETVKRFCSQILQNHGAQPLTVPLLLPSLTLYDCNETVVRIMDCTGKIVMLAPDLRVPFVRYISQKNISSLKRYTIDRVYCKAEKNGIHPKERLECAFDIIARTSPEAIIPPQHVTQSFDPAEQPDHLESPPTASQLTRDELPPKTPSQADDVEIVCAAVQILEQFPVLTKNGYTCHLNHVFLTQAVLLNGGVPAERLDSAISALSVTDFNKDEDDYCKTLTTALGELHLSAHDIDLLKCEGSIEDISCEMKRITNEEHEASRLAKDGIHELRVITRWLGIMVPKLSCRVSLGLLTPARYSSGFIFQLTSETALKNSEKEPIVIAVGYRYDDLLQKFRESKRKNDVMRGAGVSIYIDTIAKSLAPGKRLDSSIEQDEQSSSNKYNRRDSLDTQKGVISAASTSDCSVRESGTLANSVTPDTEFSKFELPHYSWDIAVHQDRIFVAAYALGMYEYTLDGQKLSCWQAPSWRTHPRENSENPPDIVYTVHTMRDGRVLVGLQKSREVVILRRHQLPASADNANCDEGEINWEEENRITVDARPWRLSSDGLNRIAVIHASDDPKIRPDTKVTVALLSDGRTASHSLSFPIASVAVSKNMLFFASLRDKIPGPKKQQRSVLMAHDQDFTLRWNKEIEENVFDVACDSSGCKVYLALGGNDRRVIALDGGSGNVLTEVLPYCEESPLRLSISDGSSPSSLAVLRYDKKTVEVHTVN